MWARNSRPALPWIIGVLLLTLATVSACDEVRVVDTTPDPGAPGAVESSVTTGATDHNLSVLAVEFDPPLDYQQLILRRQSITLLVAIENRGSSVEHDVTVRAELSTSEDSELLLTQGASVGSIAPGEIQVVRFARLGAMPYHQHYHLEVMVDPVEGETRLDDNRKAFDIQILQE